MAVLKPFLFLSVILLLWGFAFLTGLSSSVVRAVVMCSFGLLSMLIPACRKLTLNTLGVTAFLMLLFNPVWLFDVGFQLSFSAVAAIVLLQPGLYGLLSVKNRLCVRRGAGYCFRCRPDRNGSVGNALFFTLFHTLPLD